jgi:hypothetical protein
MFGLRKFDHGDRFCLWPISLGWISGWTPFFTWHGWGIGHESCLVSETGNLSMPGYRDIYGQTLHLGPLKIMFGPRKHDVDKWCSINPPPKVGDPC